MNVFIKETPNIARNVFSSTLYESITWSPEKTADILRGHHRFLREITSEELAQKLMTCHSTDTPIVQLSLPDLKVFSCSILVDNLRG